MCPAGFGYTPPMTEAPSPDTPPTALSDDGHAQQAPVANVRPLDLAALAVGHRGAVLRQPDGTPERLAPTAAIKRISDGLVPMVCHAPATARRLNTSPFPALDLLELFAFVRPATFCRPTPSGLAAALGLDKPTDIDDRFDLILNIDWVYDA